MGVVDEWIATKFEALGRFVGNRPKTTIAGSVGVMVLCMIGFMNFRTEQRSDKLWVSQETESIVDMDWVSNTWDYDPRFNTYLAKEESGGDALTPSAIQAFYSRHTELMSIEVAATDSALYPGLWDFNRTCVRMGDSCMMYSVLDLFDYDSSVIASLTQAEVDARYGNSSYYYTQYGTPFEKSDVFGYNDKDSSTTVRVLKGMYVVEPRVVTTSDNERINPVSEPWETKGIDEIRSGNNAPLNELPIFMQGWRTEFSSAIQGDIAMVSVALMLIVLYLFVVLGRRDPVDCSIGLSLAAVVSIGMAIAASYGFSSACGYMYTPLHGTIPFLLLGLGVDDAFILVSEYRRACQLIPDSKDYAGRFGMMMRHGGMSIMITSITDFLAFMIGSVTVLPALSSFCFFTGIGVLFDFFFQITFFTACMVLDSYRANAERRDCCCCFKFAADQTAEGDQGGAYEPQRSPVRGCCCSSACCMRDDYMSSAFERLSGLIVTNPVGRWGMVVVMVALTTLGIVGMAHLEVNIKLTWFLPGDSYLVEAIGWNTDYFPAKERCGIYTKSVTPYFDKQAQLQGLSSALVSSEWVSSMHDWHTDFLAWAATSGSGYAGYLTPAGYFNATSAAAYYTAIKAYTAGAGSRYEDDIQWSSSSDPAAGIANARYSVYMTTDDDQDGVKKYNTLTGVRGIVKSQFGDGDAIAFSQRFIFWEEYGIIKDELSTNLLIAVLVMLFIVAMMIPKVGPAGCVIFCIFITILQTCGIAYFWDLHINSVSTIYTLVSVGLSVDYCTHVGHIFHSTPGQSSVERSRSALARIGPSVFNAVGSTFLAVLCTSNSQSYVFKVFFKLFFLVTVLGGINGLMVLPALLALVGGTSDAAGKDGEVVAVANGANGAQAGGGAGGNEAVQLVQMKVVQPIDNGGVNGKL